MRSLEEISADIQKVSVENISDSEALKQMLSYLVELLDRKQEIIGDITDLAEDYNKMAHQTEESSAEEDKKDGFGYQNKRDAYRACVKILEKM